MRVLVVGGFAPSLLNFRGPLLKAMVARGHEVFACAPDATWEIIQKLSEEGVHYCHVPLKRAGLSPVSDLETLRALKKIVCINKPDRVLAYTVKPVVYSHLAIKLSHRASVYGMVTGLGYGFGKGSLKQKLIRLIVRYLYKKALKNSSGIFFQNPDDFELFNNLKLLPKNVAVTIINGSGVDLQWYLPAVLPDKTVFLLVARLLTEKGIREYYQAACRLKEKYPQTIFQLAGSLDVNPSSIRLEELLRWQTEGIIEYLGEFGDIRPAYVRSRIFVLPSYREGTPRTVLEAMAMGRPVITTDAPGCRETVVDGENGFLVPVKDSKRLEEAMERFILEPDLAEKMGQKSLQFAREKYDVHKVNAVIMEAMGL